MTRNKKKSAAFVIFAATSIMASATQPIWIPASTGTGFDVSLDVANVRELAPGRLQFWGMFNYEHSAEYKGVYPTRFFKSSKVLYQVICAEDRYAMTAIIYFSDTNGDGEIIASSDDGSNAPKFDHLVPGSVADGIASLACGLKRSLLKK